MEAFAVAIQSVINDSGFLAFTTGNAIMILVGLILLYLAFAREFEPLLLGPIAFGCLLANIPRNGFEEGVMALISAGDRKSTRLNSSHIQKSRMPSSA